MVTTLSNYLDARYRASVGEGYDGVVRVAIGGYYGTGTLLYDGRAILTAAHLFTSVTETTATVYFETREGSQSVSASNILVHPLYNETTSNNDLALVWLTDDAPHFAERHELYRESNEVLKTFEAIGYGRVGTGSSGDLENTSGYYNRMIVENTFDATAQTLKNTLGNIMSWSPNDAQLIADFDNGTSQKDALNLFLGINHKGLGTMEGLIAPGDSGGPALIEGKVAGVASYTASLSTAQYYPDSDNIANSTFGEIASWQRVSHYQQWIDESIRSMYQNAPTKAQDVQKSILEGVTGTSYAYFLVEFTGIRSSETALVSIDYTTRDGSANATEDYMTSSGTLIIYPDETYAVIPVEIIGDNIQESDETFYLDISNPVGGSFGEGVVTLTAMRTIINDDLI